MHGAIIEYVEQLCIHEVCVSTHRDTQTKKQDLTVRPICMCARAEVTRSVDDHPCLDMALLIWSRSVGFMYCLLVMTGHIRNQSPLGLQITPCKLP
jgi:hypothetical protein